MIWRFVTDAVLLAFALAAAAYLAAARAYGFALFLLLLALPLAVTVVHRLACPSCRHGLLIAVRWRR